MGRIIRDDYKLPLRIDTTRYNQRLDILDALSTDDEYFAEDPSDFDDTLHKLVDSITNVLSEDELAVVECVTYGGMSYSETARMLGFYHYSKDGEATDDHKKVSRLHKSAMKKLRVEVAKPTMSQSLAAHRLPVEAEPITSSKNFRTAWKGDGQ